MIMYDYVYCILVKTFKTDLLNQTRAKKNTSPGKPHDSARHFDEQIQVG